MVEHRGRGWSRLSRYCFPLTNLATARKRQIFTEAKLGLKHEAIGLWGCPGEPAEEAGEVALMTKPGP